MDVIVVGAGLGGLAAAVALHRAGHTVTVLERAAAPRETGAGIGVMPNGVLALEALGLGTAVRERAVPPEFDGGMRDRHGRLLLGTGQAAVEARVGAPTAVVPRRWLHGLLAAALPDGALRTGHAVTALREEADSVVVEGEEALTADAVLVADGAHSRLRSALFPEHPGLEGSGEYAARAIATTTPDVEVAPGELLDHRTGDRFGCMPMSGGDVYWYSTWRAGRADAPGDLFARHGWLRARRADWHPCAAALIDSTAPEDVHVVETARLARPLPALAVGRIALLGDAAHAMTPDLGQGACQAFEDAVALGALLGAARPAGVVRALSAYDARRRPRTSRMQAEARRMNRLLTLRGPLAMARDTAFRLVPGRMATRALAAQLRFDPDPAAART